MARRLRGLVGRMILAGDLAEARAMAAGLARVAPGARHQALAGLLAVPGAYAAARLALRLADRGGRVMERLRAPASVDRTA